jgi:hypothetical protein
MDGRRSLLLVGVVLLLGGACDSRPLDPGASNPGGDPHPGGGPLPPTPLPTPAPDALLASLKAAAGPSSLLVVGTNAGALTRAPAGGVQFFQSDPETLVEAAAVIQMPVCSVELQALAVSTTGGGTTDGMTIDAALAECDQQDFGTMLDRLNALKTASTVVVIAANTAITVHSTNNGINYFYDADIVRLLRAARKLYVAACVIAPESLAVPTYPQGQSAGLSIDAALASCGRS